MNLIHYVKNSKVVIVNLDLVLQFRESDEVTPRLQINYTGDEKNFVTIPYLWSNFLKKFYPAEEE